MSQKQLKVARSYILKILRRVDKQQANKFEKLKFPAVLIASRGILRHFRAWLRDTKTEEQLIAKVDITAIREIIDKAIKSARVSPLFTKKSITKPTAIRADKSLDQ